MRDRWMARGAKRVYGLALAAVWKLGGADVAKTADARFRFHRRLNLKEPVTLADKVSWLSLHALPPLAVGCTDKWEARAYVAGKGFPEILVPVCGGPWSAAAEIDFTALPERFVLKATHGCGMNWVCRDRGALDEKRCRRSVERWLRTTYGTWSVEPHYREIPHRVYCEEYLEAPGGELVDYKIHCIDGEPSFVLVCSGRAESVRLDLYTMDWQPIPGVRAYGRHVPGSGSVPRPENLAEMAETARWLAAGFRFVRVDLYSIRGRVYFGELTFTPANGVFPSYPETLLRAEGRKLTLESRGAGT